LPIIDGKYWHPQLWLNFNRQINPATDRNELEIRYPRADEIECLDQERHPLVGIEPADIDAGVLADQSQLRPRFRVSSLACRASSLVSMELLKTVIRSSGKPMETR
jgi:hypothetical protein